MQENQQRGINERNKLSKDQIKAKQRAEEQRVRRTNERAEKELIEEREQQKAIFQEKLGHLADTAIRLSQKNPDLAEMLMSILEVMLELGDVLETIESIQQAMSCVSTAINIMNNAININQLVFDVANSQNHGFFARMKARREQKRAIRNTINGMKQVATGIINAFDMVEGINNSMRSMASTLKIKMDKAKAKRQKKAAKSGGAPTNTRAQQFMAERAKSTGASVDTSSTGSSSFGGSGSGNAADDVFGDN